MLTDGLKSEEREVSCETLDVVELLAEFCLESHTVPLAAE
jgi:hypothetical protein